MEAAARGKKERWKWSLIQRAYASAGEYVILPLEDDEAIASLRVLLRLEGVRSVSPRVGLSRSFWGDLALANRRGSIWIVLATVVVGLLFILFGVGLLMVSSGFTGALPPQFQYNVGTFPAVTLIVVGVGIIILGFFLARDDP